MGHGRRAACAVLWALLAGLVACGRTATGAPLAADAPLDPAAAASTTVEALAAASAPGTEAETSRPDEHLSTAHRSAGPAAAPPVPAGTSPTPARAGTGPAPSAVNLVADPKPNGAPAAPAPSTTVRPQPPTHRAVEPTRTPAPLLIEPISAYSAPLSGFRSEVARVCHDAGVDGCLHVVPSDLGSAPPGTDLENCTVVSSSPDLHAANPDDPAEYVRPQIPIARDEIPKTIAVDVKCDIGSGGP